MKRNRDDITLKYLKSLKWERYKIDTNADVADTAIADTINDCSLGQGMFWINLEYIKENYEGRTPLTFQKLNNCQDVFLDEKDYYKLIQYIRDDYV